MDEDLFLFRFAGETEFGVDYGLQIGNTSYSLGRGRKAFYGLNPNHSAEESVAELLALKHSEMDIGVDDSEYFNLPPIHQEEVWGAEGTFSGSGASAVKKSSNEVERPQLFYKACWYDLARHRGEVGMRYDSIRTVPEPELVVLLNGEMEVVGFTIGNDMTASDLLDENPLFLAQAKVYKDSCAIGPRIWLQPGCTAWPELTIHMTINRQGQTVFEGETSTRNFNISLTDLISYLGRCKEFLSGVFLFTGTGIVPPDTFTLAAEDEVRIKIDPIGELVNTVKVVGGKD